MAIVAECPKCGKRFKAGENQAGRKAKCTGCGHVFVIGEDTAAPSAPATAAPAPPSRPAAAPPKVPGALPPVTSHKPARPGNLAANSASAAPKAPGALPPAPRASASKPAPAAPAKTVASTQPAPAPAAARNDPVTAPGFTQCSDNEPAPADDASTSAAPVVVEQAPPVAEELPTRRAKLRLKPLLLVAVLLIAGGAAAFFLPPLLNKPRTNGPGVKSNALNAGPVALVMAGDFTSAPAAWNVAPDGGQDLLRVPETFRLVIPTQPPLRFVPAQIIFAPSAQPFAAIPAWPEGDQTGPEILSIWDLAKQSRIAQFKLAQHLEFPLLSPGGTYYAGQVFDEAEKTIRIEVWSTTKAQLVYSLNIPNASRANFGLAAGFSSSDQLLTLGDKLRVVDVASKAIQREVPLPPWTLDTRVAASHHLKLIAIGDSRGLYLVDVAAGKVMGPMPIAESVLAHPRKRLAMRAMDFSPDGSELAMAFDNRQSARRIAVVDVAAGKLTAVHVPATPVYSGGPELQWLADGKAWLVGSGMLIDRATARQIGQVFTDMPDEGLGGQLGALLSSDRALIAWDKHPRSLVLRSVAFQREKAEWVRVEIASARATRYDSLDCMGREFGNTASVPHILQRGRLTDGSRFLAVDLKFTASCAKDAPAAVPLRQDQFTLLADGVPRSPIGTLAAGGVLALEKPEYEIRKDEPLKREPTVVFAIGGDEKSLVLQVGSAQHVLAPPASAAVPVKEMARPVAERLSPQIFSAPDDASAMAARVVGSRFGPLEVEPEAADQIPLRVTYSSPDAWLLTVKFELTAKTARNAGRNSRNEPPRMGLLLPDGTHLRPVTELPGPLPALMTPGENYARTCMFVLRTDPVKMRAFRLTCDGLPVATVTTDSSTANITP